MKFGLKHRFVWIFLIVITIFMGCSKPYNNNDALNKPEKELLTDDKVVDETIQDEARLDGIKPDEITTDKLTTGKLTTDKIDDQEDLKDQVNQEEDTREISDDNQISLIMVGDVLLHTNIHDSGIMEDGSYNYDHLFANVKEDIEVADLAIVNQEVILGGIDLGLSGYPSFNGAYEVGDALVNAGFDVVLHATNHTLDKGKKGVLNCMNFWKKYYPDIAVLGINESQEAQDNDIYVYEQDGISIAILNYTYGTNGIKLPSDMPYIVNLIDKKKIEAHVKKANELADFVIVTPHWGTEYQHSPSKHQTDLALYMAELGVDLVIGTHPHVVQPVEWIESENGNKMLVFYSIGNFINSTSGTGSGVADRMIGAMANVTISLNTDGEVYIQDYAAEPLVTHMKFGPGYITTYKFSDYSDTLSAENEIIKQDSNFSFDYCINVWNEVYPEFQQQY